MSPAVARLLPLLLAVCPGPLLAAERSPAVAPVGVGDLLQVLAALLVVLLIFAGAAYLIRRMGQLNAGATGALQVLGGVSVGQRERVVLIQVGKQQVLVGVAPGRVQTLHVLEEPVEVRPGAVATESFAARLAAAMQRGKGR